MSRTTTSGSLTDLELHGVEVQLSVVGRGRIALFGLSVSSDAAASSKESLEKALFSA